MSAEYDEEDAARLQFPRVVSIKYPFTYFYTAISTHWNADELGGENVARA